MLLVFPRLTASAVDEFNLNLLDQLAEVGWAFTVATTEGPHDLYREYERRTTDLFPLVHFLPLPHQPSFLRYPIETRRPDVVLSSNSVLGYRLLPYIRGLCPDTPLIDFCHSETEALEQGRLPAFLGRVPRPSRSDDDVWGAGETLDDRAGWERITNRRLSGTQSARARRSALRLRHMSRSRLWAARINELLERAIELHRTDPGPVPSRSLSRLWATQSLELTRLDRLNETTSASGVPFSGRRGGARLLYALLRRIGRPLYRFGF